MSQSIINLARARCTHARKRAHAHAHAQKRTCQQALAQAHTRTRSRIHGRTHAHPRTHTHLPHHASLQHRGHPKIIQHSNEVLAGHVKTSDTPDQQCIDLYPTCFSATHAKSSVFLAGGRSPRMPPGRATLCAPICPRDKSTAVGRCPEPQKQKLGSCTVGEGMRQITRISFLQSHSLGAGSQHRPRSAVLRRIRLQRRTWRDKDAAPHMGGERCEQRPCLVEVTVPYLCGNGHGLRPCRDLVKTASLLSRGTGVAAPP